MPIRHGVFGKADGNFRAYPSNHRFAADPYVPLRAARDALSVEKGFNIENIMRLGCVMGTNILNADDPEAWQQTELYSVWSPKAPADGAVTYRSKTAIVLPNGDCPAIVIWDLTRRLTALLHGGLGALVPKDGSPGIIERFVDEYEISPGMYVMASYGIGPCCYGLDDLPKCTPNALVKKWPKGGATIGPRAGKISIDLFRLIELQCRQLGLKDHQICVRNETLACTACKKTTEGEFMYWSNSRAGSKEYQADEGRNLVYVFNE